MTVALSATACIATGVAGFALAEHRIAPEAPPPPPLDFFEQGVDLSHIESMQPLNDEELAVRADGDKRFTLEFTAPCAGLSRARVIALATDGYRNLDRFIGIVIDGRLCTFKDFRTGV